MLSSRRLPAVTVAIRSRLRAGWWVLYGSPPSRFRSAPGCTPVGGCFTAPRRHGWGPLPAARRWWVLYGSPPSRLGSTPGCTPGGGSSTAPRRHGWGPLPAARRWVACRAVPRAPGLAGAVVTVRHHRSWARPWVGADRRGSGAPPRGRGELRDKPTTGPRSAMHPQGQDVPRRWRWGHLPAARLGAELRDQPPTGGTVRERTSRGWAGGPGGKTSRGERGGGRGARYGRPSRRPSPRP